MRRAFVAVGLASLALASSAATAAGGGATGPEDARCDVTARGTGEREILFRTRCNFEPFQLKLRPSTGVRRVAAAPELSPTHPGDGFSCEQARRGRIALCGGHMEDGATARVRFRPAGDACETAIRWAVMGGVDCDDGEACIDIALAESGTVSRPRGC